MQSVESSKLILVTGATGYVGGRLVARLAADGHAVRCMARRPEQLAGRFAPQVALARGDVNDPASLREALAGVDTAYYLIHALGASGDLEAQERRGARNFAEAAKSCGVRRLIYL